MIKNYKNYITLILILFFAGCSVFTAHGRAFKKAENAQKRGDYYQSVLECVKSIKEKPDFEKPLLLMDNVFPMAVKTYNQKIDRFLKKENKNWDMIINSYKEIIYLIDYVGQLNLLKQEIWFNSSEMRDYEMELTEVKSKAAIFYYDKATELMQKNEQESYKKAAQSFKKTQKYVSDFKDSQELYEYCREKAIKRIAIMAFENKSGTDEFGAIGEEVSDAIIAKMLKDSDLMEYVEIVSSIMLSEFRTTLTSPAKVGVLPLLVKENGMFTLSPT